MNFYNPYFYTMPYTNLPIRTGIFSRLFRNGFNFNSILSGTQKTLNFINQAIPAIRNVSPVVKNAKTMFKVMSEFKKNDSNNIINKKNLAENKQENLNNKKNNVPTFFI